MNGRRTELPHNTREQVRDYLREALAVVDERDVPDDLRAAAFGKAVDLLSAKQITLEAIQPGLGALAVPRGL